MNCEQLIYKEVSRGQTHGVYLQKVTSKLDEYAVDEASLNKPKTILFGLTERLLYSCKVVTVAVSTGQVAERGMR
jgi:hypothetical protein